MTYETYLKLLLNYRKFQTNISALYDLGIDLMESKYAVSDIPYDMLEAAFRSHYTEAGWDWVSWYILENDWGEKDWGQSKRLIQNDDGSISVSPPQVDVACFGATDGDGHPIAYSFESLYSLLEEYKIN
jgi:hypothetical protein